MRNRNKVIALLLICVLLLSGCELNLPGPLQKFTKFLDDSPIVCVVTAKEGLTLTVEVQSPDSHYDEGDTLTVIYQTIQNGKEIRIGDQITFSYDYMTDVTVRNDDPCIKTEVVTLTQWEPTVPAETN